MFIQTEMTSEPARMTFLPGCEVRPEGRLDLREKDEATISPLAERLFAISGVSGVSFDSDAITVTKSSGDWQYLKPVILGVIMEHFRSGAPLLRRESDVGDRRSGRPDGDDAASERVRDALRRVIDPELGFNIVDLGLVYSVSIEGERVVHVTMTTTTPGCPATNYLKEGARESIRTIAGVERVEVNLTYDPRWTPEMMSPEAKAFLGITDGVRP